MAAAKLNRKTFQTLIIVFGVLICILIAGLIFISAGPGLSLLHPENTSGTTEPGTETGPWGTKTYTWDWKNTTHSAGITVSKEQYQQFNTGQPGANLTGYVISSGDGNILASLSSQISGIAARNNYDEKETVDLVIAFARSLPYAIDTETGHSAEYPRTPIVTLADQTGDSQDLTILTAALLKSMGYASALLSYPAICENGILVPQAAALGIPGTSDADGPVYSCDNQTFETVWIADTSAKGYPAIAYYIEQPEISVIPGRTAASSAKDTLPTAETFSIPKTVIDPGTSWNTWRGKSAAFYESGWSSSGIIWTANDPWKLYEHYLSIADVPSMVSTPWGTTEYTTNTPWRLTYTVNVLPKDTINGMTPYSNADIAVYSLETNSPRLLDTFGWQGTSDASTRGKSPMYPPGEYAIGVFVRNVDISIAVEYGQQQQTAYTGGI